MSNDETQATAPASEAAEPVTPSANDETQATKASPKKQSESTDVEYRFTGDPEVGMAGVPARDLTYADIDRIITRRTIPNPGARGLHRGEAGFSEARSKVTRELSATGKFKKRS